MRALYFVLFATSPPQAYHRTKQTRREKRKYFVNENDFHRQFML